MGLLHFFLLNNSTLHGESSGKEGGLVIVLYLLPPQYAFVSILLVAAGLRINLFYCTKKLYSHMEDPFLIRLFVFYVNLCEFFVFWILITYWMHHLQISSIQ